MIQVANYIGGNFVTPRRSVDIFDYSQKDILARVPDSDAGQIRSIRRSIEPMQIRLKDLSLDIRKRTVERILKDYLADRFTLRAACTLKGTPVQQVEVSLEKLHQWVRNLDSFLDLAIGNRGALESGYAISFADRTIATRISRPSGATFIVLSGNMDAWEQFYILSQGILAGTHMVVRASTRDIAAHEFFRVMHEIGYFAGGQLITWDSGKPDSIELFRMIFKMCPQAILFGSSATITRITEVRDAQGELVEDLSKSVRIAKYGTGLPTIIVTPNADLDQAARHVLQGAIEFRGAHCVSTSPVFVHESVRIAFKDRLLTVLSEICDADPLGVKTGRSGYSEDELDNLDHFVSTLREEASILAGLTMRDTNSASPFIFDGVPWTSRLLRDEIVGPVIGLIQYDDIDNLVHFTNGLATERGIRRHILTVVHGSEDEAMYLRRNLATYLVRRNVSSSDQDLFLPHQGTYFIRDMLEDVY